VNEPRDRRLMAHGFLIFTASILVGSVATWLPAPRMGLSCHLNGLMTGMMLVLMGLIWNRLALSGSSKTLLFWLAVVGVYCSFAMHLFAAVFPSGNRFMPFASEGKVGTDWQEAVIFACNVLIGATLIPGSLLTAWGLWRRLQN
jgi:hydroxylaminobenzene mutase